MSGRFPGGHLNSVSALLRAGGTLRRQYASSSSAAAGAFLANPWPSRDPASRAEAAAALLPPEGTLRRKMLRLPRRLVHSLRTRGLQGTLQAMRRRLHHNLLTEQGRYQAWIEENQPSSKDLRAQRAWSQAAGPRPMITLILPLAEETPLHHLGHTVGSLLQQSFPRWQLCVAGHPAEVEPINRLIHRLGGSDTRLAVTVAAADRTRDSYLGTALEAAGGDFVAVVRPGDLLAPHALYEIARALVDEPDSDVVYSDEDCLSSKTGQRFGLALKPDWSPELMVAYNYLGRLAVIRRSLLLELGGFDAEYGEAQEWDLLLRLSERHQSYPPCSQVSVSPPDRCRGRPGLVAGGHGTPVPAGGTSSPGPPRPRRPGGNHAQRDPAVDLARGRPAPCQHYHSYPQPPGSDPAMRGRTGRQKTAYPHKEIILVDNDSTDPAVQPSTSLGHCGLVQIVPFNREFNYSAACNTGYRTPVANSCSF